MKLTAVQERKLKIAARGKSTVLITGPTGSGKSTLARNIHDSSSRRNRNFITVNLASMHEGTLESELFGHEKGAFTGADQKRIGRLQQADGGTVFLDEIGELSPRLQARLLQFLQMRTIQSVGGGREIKLDVRVICATHQDLISAITKGNFREDLFHRIRVITLELESLSQRSEDFDSILHDCLESICDSTGKSVLRISESVARALEEYHWPGNFRELRNVLEYAVQASEGVEVTVNDLPDWFLKPMANLMNQITVVESGLSKNVVMGVDVLGVAEVPMSLDFYDTLANFEKIYLERALKKFSGKISQTARKIGVNKSTLMRRMDSHKIVL